MGIPLGSNFDLTAALPLDSRIVAADITARNAISSVARFIGLEVYVESENKKYRLEGGILDGNWTEMGSLDVALGAATRIPYMNGLADNFIYSGNLTFDGTTLEATELALTTGTTVDTIESTLTNDNDHLPTSGAVWAALAGLTSMSWNGSTPNAVGTYGGVNTIDAEQYLIYNAGILTVGGGEGTSELRLAHNNSAYDWIWQAQGDTGLMLSHYTDNFILFATPTILIYQNVDIDGGFTLGAGGTVDYIENALTDDATHLPSSHAVYDAVAAVPTQILNLGTPGQVPYMNGLGDDFVYTGITMVSGVLEVPGGMKVSSLSLSTSPKHSIIMATGSGDGTFLTDANFTFNTTQEALTIGGGASTSNLIMDYSGSSQPYEITASSTSLHIHEYSTTIMTLTTSGMALRTGERVDTIEASLTDDDTHIATSGAIFGALAAQAVTYGGLEQIPYVDLGSNGFQYTAGFNFTGANLNVPGLANVDGVQLDIAYVSPDSSLAGLLTWNANDFTLNIGTGIGTTIQVAQEDLILIYNNTGADLTDGKVVQVGGGATGGNPWARYAQADTFENCDRIIAIMTSTVTAGNVGFATRRGKVRGVDTSVIGAGKIYLSPTSSGDITTTEPVFPNYVFELGGVTQVGVLDGVIDIYVEGAIANTFHNFWNGVVRESYSFTVTEAAGVVTGHLDDKEGNDSLTYLFDDGLYLADTSSSIDIILTQGTATDPITNYVYIPTSTKVLTLSTTAWPSEEHIKIAQVVLQSATETALYGALRNQNMNDHIQGTDGQGHLSHMTAKIRRFEAQWDSGTEGASSVDAGPTPDDVWITVTSGSIFQMHPQSFPSFDTETGDVVHVANHPVTSYLSVSNLNGQILDATGVSLNNSSFSFVLWGVVNSGTEPCQLMINLPVSSYSHNAPDTAVQDPSNYSVYSIPTEFQGVGFLIARFTYTYKNNAWALYDTEDLRGSIPNTTAGGGIGGTGVTTFLALTDTPASYIGEALNIPQVNAAETALEFTSTPLVTRVSYGAVTEYIEQQGGELAFTDSTNGTVLLSALISSLTTGTSTQVPFTNAGGNDFDYSADLTFNNAGDNFKIGGSGSSSTLGLDYTGAAYAYEFTATAAQLLLHLQSTNILSMNASGIALTTGARVNTIETAVTDDDTHLPTSGAIVDYVSSEAYVHPNHTGQVVSVGDGAQTLDHSAVDGQTAHPGLVGSETMLMEDSNVLYSIAMAQLQTYLNASLNFNDYTHPNHTGHVTSTGDGATVLTIAAITGQPELTAGIATTDELLINDGGVLKRVDMTFVEAYMQSNLSFYSHPNHSGEVTSAGDGAQTVEVTAISNRSYVPSVTGSEDFLVKQGSGLWKASMTQMETYLNANLSFNNYTHPNHTGQVTSTGDGAQVLHHSAVDGQGGYPGLVGSENLLIEDSNSLYTLAMAQLESYLQSALSFGTSDVSINGSTSNGVGTYGGTDTIDIESTMTYSGSSGYLRIGGGASTSTFQMYTTASYNWWMEADADLYITWGYYTSTYLTLTSGGLTHEGSVRGKTNVYAGDNTTAYNAAFVDNSIVVATTAAGTRSGIEMVGTQTTDTSVGTLSWHNTNATQADKRVAQIDGGRSGGDSDAGYLRMYTATTAGTLTERMNIDDEGAVRFGYGNTTQERVVVHSTNTRIATEQGYFSSTEDLYFSGTTPYNVEGFMARPYSYQTQDYTMFYQYGGSYGGIFHRQGTSMSDMRMDYNYWEWGVGTTSTAWTGSIRMTTGYIQVKGSTTAALYLDAKSSSYDTIIYFREATTPKAVLGYDTGINAFQIHTGSAYTSLAAADFSITDAGEIYMGNIDVASNTNYLRHNTTTGEVTYYSSDRRLKKNIRDFDVDALAVLSRFSPKTFEWIDEDDDKISNGWIAQEGVDHIENMFPIVEKTGLYTISEGEILPYYHKAIMQLEARIKDLETQLAEK